MTAAERMAALDSTDPYPSVNEMAARAGCEPPVLRPGDRALCQDYSLALYWPDVKVAT